jgi:hypothetical protein
MEQDHGYDFKAGKQKRDFFTLARDIHTASSYSSFK